MFHKRQAAIVAFLQVRIFRSWRAARTALSSTYKSFSVYTLAVNLTFGALRVIGYLLEWVGHGIVSECNLS